MRSDDADCDDGRECGDGVRDRIVRDGGVLANAANDVGSGVASGVFHCYGVSGGIELGSHVSNVGGFPTCLCRCCIVGWITFFTTPSNRTPPSSCVSHTTSIIRNTL